MSLEKIQPVSPAAGYIGGKRNLAARLVSMIGKVDHDSYAEPFVGMGGIFLRRRARPKAEAINDISGDVATFFRVLQEHYPYFIDMLRWRVASRAGSGAGLCCRSTRPPARARRSAAFM